MRIPLEFYELLRERISILEIVRQKVNLTKKSGGYFGLCPFHQEKTPSFSVNIARRSYHCFGCGAHGDLVQFVSKVTGLSYSQAAVKIAGDYGIELPKLSKNQELFYEESSKIMKILDLASGFFKTQITKEVSTYLEKRNMNQELIDIFNIGFAPSGKNLLRFFEKKSISIEYLEKAGLVKKAENGKIYEIFQDRIIFPIYNIYNKVIAFGGRVIGDNLPKYLNSPEILVFKKGETLYAENLALASSHKRNRVILVEGYMDVISLHKAGFTETMASLGTAVTQIHCQKLWNYIDEIVICLDGDIAGINASTKVINMILPFVTSKKIISFLCLPANNDPDDVILKNGIGFFQNLLDNRISLSQMIWNLEYEGKIFKSPEDKALLETKLNDYNNQVTDPVTRSNYIKFFKDQLFKKIHYKPNNFNNKNTRMDSLNAIDAGKNYSEIEMIEHGFCAIMIKDPSIVQDEEIRNFIFSLDFSTQELADFRDWFLESLHISSENIKNFVERSRFEELFLILSKECDKFLGIPIDEHIDINMLWSILQKKYHSLLLKNEYNLHVKNYSDDNARKASLYMEKIQAIDKEIKNLQELLMNN